MNLTAERVRELLDYDPETGVLTWKVRRGGRAHLGAVAGVPDGLGYVSIRVDSRLYRAHRLAWLLSHGRWPPEQIDHINGVRDDNRLSNLREATRGQNMENQRRPRAGNTSGFLGVCWHARSKKFMARITTGGTRFYLGVYPDAESAHAAYLKAKRELHVGCMI